MLNTTIKSNFLQKMFGGILNINFVTINMLL